jgi:uncharacterized membrane protein YqjE
MPFSTQPEAASPRPLRTWLAPWLELLQVRLQLLGLEAEEGAQRLGQLLAWGVVAAICLGLGAVCAAVLLAVLFWEEHRIAFLLGLCTLFFGLGGAAIWLIARQLRTGLQLFSASLAELQRDLNRLKP